jgi:hypothetical protein
VRIFLSFKDTKIVKFTNANIVHFAVPNVIIQVGSWICMIVFSIRVIGEFNYNKKDKDKNAQSGIYKPVSILAKCVSFCRLKIPKLSLSFLLAIIL